jgi:hypothetical protein
MLGLERTAASAEEVNKPFRASRTDIEPDEPAASAETSTSSAGATGEVGSSPSDCRAQTC